MNEEAIFNAARRIDDPVERQKFIDHACMNDAKVLERIRALLDIHQRDPHFLEPPPKPETIDMEPISERAGSMVGPYRLMEQIGEGGFGLVFVAEQQEPVRRKVAIKVIKPGMDTREVIARFEAERQALALMDHPNIARVLDVGATDTGRPYFVMELIKGISITKYCDQNQLTPAERLQLFINVCQAVQHAHQKGIIHRDIKPSNVLVTSHDGKPVVKIIDFGVAKAVNQQLTARTIYTRFTQMIGTPLYMSPEQAEMSGLDIDTRSDIYSLGVLLYELLTGTTPVDRKRFQEATYDELRRMIREDEPLKPSTRSIQSGDSLPSVAAQRKTEPAKLSKIIRGDLDWITMKALEKDRTRRYETANGLARDVERYLNNEEVEACPPSAAYRLRKFVRRHGQPIAIAAAFAGLLIGAAIVSGMLAWKATNAHLLTIAALNEAAIERIAANKARDAETEQRKVAEAVRDLKTQALKRAEGLRLTAQSSAVLPNNPGLALLLAIEGAKRHPGRLANNSLLAGLESIREEKTIRVNDVAVDSAEFSLDGKRILTMRRRGYVEVVDAVSGQKLTQLVPFATHHTEARFSPDSRLVATRYAGRCTLSLSGQRPIRYSDEVVYLWDSSSGRPLFRLSGHTDFVTAMDFSSDNRRLATASWDGTVRLWDTTTGEQLRQWTESKGSWDGVRFSPDGQRLLAFSALNTRSRHGPNADRPKWDDPSPSEMTSLRSHLNFSYTTSSGSLYGGTEINETAARLWEIETGAELAAIKRPGPGHAFANSSIHHASFSKEFGRILLVGDDRLHVWDAKMTLETIIERDLWTGRAEFDANSHRILSVLGDSIQILHAPSGKWMGQFSGPSRKIVGFDLSHDGRYVAAAFDDKTCCVWAWGESTVAVLKGHEAKVSDIKFAKDSYRIVTASDDGTIRIWQVAPTDSYAKRLTGHHSNVTDLEFDPSSRTLATSSDGTVRLWDTASGRQLRSLVGHTELAGVKAVGSILGTVHSVQFSPDGSKLLAGGGESKARLQYRFLSVKLREVDVPFSPARIWDVQSGKELFQLPGERRGVDFAQYSANGELVMGLESRTARDVGVLDSETGNSIVPGISGGGEPAAIRVWNAGTGKLSFVAKRDKLTLYGAVMSPDGSRIVGWGPTADHFVRVYVWDGRTGQELFEIVTKSRNQQAATFSADGKRILCFSIESVETFDATTGKPLISRTNPTLTQGLGVFWVVADPTGRRLVVRHMDVLHLYDAESMEPLMRLSAHGQSVNSAVFSRDGSMIVTASDDETARVWNAATGEEIMTLKGHTGPVTVAKFSPDGKQVATGSADGTARIWQLDLLPIAEARKPRELTAEEKKRFEIE